MKHLLYITKFIPKTELPFDLKEGRVYEGFQDGRTITLRVGEQDQLWLDGPMTDREAYYCEATAITPDNYKEFKYKKEDKLLVYGAFEMKQVIQAAAHKAQEEQNAKADQAYDDLELLENLDPGVFDSTGEVLTHIVNTFRDKYEDGFPEIDMTNLMRNSPHSVGFNCGNAAKYIRRYMTIGHDKSGDVKDIYKAVHYLLMQIDSHRNGQV